jgi:hypothetical protein
LRPANPAPFAVAHDFGSLDLAHVPRGPLKPILPSFQGSIASNVLACET